MVVCVCDEILIVSETAVGFHESFRGFSRPVFNFVLFPATVRTVQLYVARTVQVSTSIVDKKLKTPFLRPQSFFHMTQKNNRQVT